MKLEPVLIFRLIGISAALVMPQSFKAASIIGMVLDFFSQGFNDHVRGNEALQFGLEGRYQKYIGNVYLKKSKELGYLREFRKIKKPSSKEFLGGDHCA